MTTSARRRYPRWHPATLRAALWAFRASRVAVRAYARSPFRAPNLPRVPRVPVAAERGVHAVLRRNPRSCLVQATVWQAWDAAHGLSRDLVVGVTTPSSGFAAHAWLDGDAVGDPVGYVELLRRPSVS